MRILVIAMKKLRALSAHNAKNPRDEIAWRGDFDCGAEEGASADAPDWHVAFFQISRRNGWGRLL